MQESFFKQIISKPPILFPLAALFHIIFTALAITTLYPVPLSETEWLRPLAMLLFTFLSVGLCLMKKFIAILYVLLSITCLALYYYFPVYNAMHIFGISFFPFNLILSLFILLYFKRFE